MDLQRFLQAALQPRQASVDVPLLKPWFGDAAPVWVVRGLTAAEMARAEEAARGHLDNIRAMVDALVGDAADKAASFRRALGLSESDVPADISRRIEMLTAGAVNPELGPNNREVAVKLAENFPGVFYALTNAIINLTGQGSEPGKPPRSGQTHG
jgi:hypothetical protein